MTVLLDKETNMPPYLIMPWFLLEMELNNLQRLVYMLLLNRLRLSMKNPRFQDEEGRPFVLYPIPSLARDTKKSPTTIKGILNKLEAQDLIVRRRQGRGYPNRIYIKVKAYPQKRKAQPQPTWGYDYHAEPWESL